MMRRTTIAVLVLLSACATNRAPDTTMDSTPLRDVIVTDTPTTTPHAAQRVVETTVPPTTTTTHPHLTAEQVHLILASNDPPTWSFTIDQVTQGNIDLFSDICHINLANQPPPITKLGLAAWFADHLIELGIEEDPGFNTDGMIDDLVALGCPTPTTTLSTTE